MRRKRRKIRPVLSRPTLLAGALLAAGLGVFLWRQVLSSRGSARDVPIARVPAIDQTDIDPAVLRLISGARGGGGSTPFGGALGPLRPVELHRRVLVSILCGCPSRACRRGPMGLVAVRVRRACVGIRGRGSVVESLLLRYRIWAGRRGPQYSRIRFKPVKP
jgi:hypothetical protein